MVSVLPFGQFGAEKHGENLWNLSVMSSHRAVFKNFTQFLFDWGFPALFRDVVLWSSRNSESTPFQTFAHFLELYVGATLSYFFLLFKSYKQFLHSTCLHQVYYISYTTPQRVCCISALIAAIFTTAKSLPDLPWYRCSPHGGMKGINANPPPGYFVLYMFHLASRRDAPGSHLKCSSDGRVVGLTLDFVTLEGSLSKQLGLALGTGQKSPREYDVIWYDHIWSIHEPRSKHAMINLVGRKWFRTEHCKTKAPPKTIAFKYITCMMEHPGPSWLQKPGSLSHQAQSFSWWHGLRLTLEEISQP